MSAERILRPAWPKPAERPKPPEYLAGAFVTTIWDEPSTDDADDNISSDHVLAGWHQLSKAADRKALKCCECGEPLDLHGVAGYASVASSGDPRVREYIALCLGCGKNRHAVLAKLHGFLARMFDPDFRSDGASWIYSLRRHVSSLIGFGILLVSAFRMALN